MRLTRIKCTQNAWVTEGVQRVFVESELETEKKKKKKNRKQIVMGPERLLESLQNWTENPGQLVHKSKSPLSTF